MECVVTKILVLSVVVASSMAYEIAKPGCPDECGGVKIPFPFGIGIGCYFWDNTVTNLRDNDAFKIKCDNRTDPPFPFLSDGTSKWKVLNISLEDHSIRVSSGAAYDCYDTDESVPFSTPNNTYNLLDSVWTSFELLAGRNNFVAVGCDTVAWLMDDDFWEASACKSSCAGFELETDGICDPNIGCCEASIFRNPSQSSVHVGFGNLSSMTDIQVDFYTYPCSYAFVAEVGSYNFSSDNLTATAEDCYNIRVPVVYDWHTHGRLICSTNAQHTYYDQGRCLCLEGYTGNPYLLHGCQDINECLEERLNACERREFCVNKNGGYDCRCPDGHFGNGTTTSPCIPAPGPGKLILGVSIGMSSMIGSIILYGMYKLIKRRKEIKKREANFKINGVLLLKQKISAGEVAIDRTKVFSQSELEKATDNFNDNRVLGRGGQGIVYKGMLTDGTIVAVKKSQKVDENQLAQFINEVFLLSQISHRNVVKLFGCCLETEVPMLVYEFVPNGTLYQLIHHPSEDFPMTWKVRFHTALECAEAVAYLHSSCSSPIYHRDIKSSNILLDDKYKAKISDFGTSRSISIDKTHVTTCVQGTFGYLDPEFFRSSQFSEKSDVYSFGVVLLELLTSKKPIFTNTSGEPRGLATEFLQLMEMSPNQLHDILDTEVLQHCSEEEIEALAALIEQCISLNGKQRPTMKEVAKTLEMINSQHGEEGNVADEHGIGRQEGSVLTDHTSVTIEGSCSTSNTSAISDTLNSMDVELLFDSNFEA